MKLLSTPDGKKIVVRHVVTVDCMMDHEAYRRDSLSHFKAKRDIERAKGSPDQMESLKAAMDTQFPNGEPQFKDYFRTKVTTTDGHEYWVEQDMNDVVRAVLDAS
jgi:hypothetical protein